MKSLASIVISHAVFLVMFGIAAVALAQDNSAASSTNMQAERREAATEQRAERSEERASTSGARKAKRASSSENRAEERAERVEARKAALSARAQERVTNLAANMSNRIEAAIKRLGRIIGRIESRAEKLKASGADISAAEAHLNEARLALDNATAALTGIDSEVAQTVSAEDARAAWVEVKESFKVAASQVRVAHGHMRDAVAALKQAVRDAELGQGVSSAVSNRNATSSNASGTEEVVEETASSTS